MFAIAEAQQYIWRRGPPRSFTPFRMTGHHFVILIILSVILSGSEESVFSPIIIFHILTSAQRNLILRLGRHSLCACLGFSTGICAGYHQYTLWKVSPLHTSRLFPRHVRMRPLSYATEGISPAHFSMARHGARTCRSYIMLAYNEIQKALVCGPYFRVGSTNKTCL